MRRRFHSRRRQPRTLALVDSTTSTSNTLTVPAAVKPGDLLVFYQYTTGTSIVTTAITPTGYTPIDTAQDAASGSASVAAGIAYKIATASDAGATINGLNDTSDRKVLAVFRADIPLTAAKVASTGAMTDGNPSALTVLGNSGKPTPQVAIGSFGSTGAVSPRSWTPAADGELTPATNVYLGYKVQNADVPNVNVTIDMDDEGSFNFIDLAAISGL